MDLNNDVVSEILLHLPVQSLLKFRATSKFNCGVIDSPHFKKLHFVQNTNEEEDTLLLQFNPIRGEVSMFIPNREEFSSSMEFRGCFKLESYRDSYCLRVVGPVNGLICIYNRWSKRSITICNPSLGKIKTLPASPAPPRPTFCDCPKMTDRDVGIGFDEDYKVVQLLSCYQHRRLHASVYSKGTDSWRELGLVDQQVYIIEPIKSSCRRGSFAHWRASQGAAGGVTRDVILSFDMKNEVFHVFYMPEYESLNQLGDVKIFAKDDDSFLLFIYGKWLKIYEARFEGNNLFWDFSSQIESLNGVIPTPKALWRTNLVGFSNGEVVLYDYHSRDVVRRLQLPACSSKSIFLEYKCSFIAP